MLQHYVDVIFFREYISHFIRFSIFGNWIKYFTFSYTRFVLIFFFSLACLRLNTHLLICLSSQHEIRESLVES